MNLFPKKKNCEVTFIEEHVVIIRGEKFFRHDHEYAVIKKLLNTLIKNQITIMALIDDLKAKVATLNTQVDALQTSVDNEQAQIQGLLDTNAQVVTDLNAEIARLQAIIAAGGTVTDADLQGVIDGITTASDKLSTTQADLEGTVQ